MTSAMYTRNSDDGFSAHDTLPPSDPIERDVCPDDDDTDNAKVPKKAVSVGAFVAARVA